MTPRYNVTWRLVQSSRPQNSVLHHHFLPLWTSHGVLAMPMVSGLLIVCVCADRAWWLCWGDAASVGHVQPALPPGIPWLNLGSLYQYSCPLTGAAALGKLTHRPALTFHCLARLLALFSLLAGKLCLCHPLSSSPKVPFYPGCGKMQPVFWWGLLLSCDP